MRTKGQKHIALLIFALSPEAECRQKHLSGEKGLYALLNEHALTLAKKAGIPHFHFTENEQQGNSFGERYTHAIKKIFSQGYDGIITIGNDSPGLTGLHLQTAYQSLLSGNSVLGPSLDGGFYLLAIPKSSFSEERFLSISWNSSRVFRQMYRLLSNGNGELMVLNPLSDLDNYTDIAVVLDSNINIPFGIKKVLIEVRMTVHTAEALPIYYSSIFTGTRILNRGSPALAA